MIDELIDQLPLPESTFWWSDAKWISCMTAAQNGNGEKRIQHTPRSIMALKDLLQFVTRSQKSPKLIAL
jgi:hypothetical protein